MYRNGKLSYSRPASKTCKEEEASRAGWADGVESTGEVKNMTLTVLAGLSRWAEDAVWQVNYGILASQWGLVGSLEGV